MSETNSRKLRLPSGGELTIAMSRYSPPVHHWTTGLLLAVGFDAGGQEEAEEKGIAAMVQAIERTLNDLRNL